MKRNIILLVVLFLLCGCTKQENNKSSNALPNNSSQVKEEVERNSKYDENGLRDLDFVEKQKYVDEIEKITSSVIDKEKLVISTRATEHESNGVVHFSSIKDKDTNIDFSMSFSSDGDLESIMSDGEVFSLDSESDLEVAVDRVVLLFELARIGMGFDKKVMLDHLEHVMKAIADDNLYSFSDKVTITDKDSKLLNILVNPGQIYDDSRKIFVMITLHETAE